MIALIFSKERTDTIGLYFERALKNLNIPFDHFCSSQMDRIPPTYDLYFRIADPYCERVLPVHLSPAIYWTSDIHIKSSLSHLKRQVRSYSFVTTCLPQGGEKLSPYANKVYYVSCGCDLKIHQKLDLPKKYDIGYVGTDGGIPRKFILQELKERYPESFIGTAPYTKMSEIYSQSKIGFNYPIRLEGMTMRSFEIPACGTIQFMPKLPKGWIEDLGFFHQRNIIIYENFKELIQLIDYYLVHDEERERIAKAGYDHVRNHHTYTQKLKEIMTWVEKDIGLSYQSFS